MLSKTFLSCISLLAAYGTFAAANGQEQKPEALILYNATLPANGTATPQSLVYTTWNQNLTLTGISATSMLAAGGNAMADLGYSCVFASGGNPGGVHTISLDGPPSNLATNPVEIKWICCGDCAAGKTAGGNDTTSTTTGQPSTTRLVASTGTPRPTGNSTTSVPRASNTPSASSIATTNAGAVTGVGLASIMSTLFIGSISLAI
ncbi:hypothetical protein M409DRAFT_59521 [Zasmidium cellare ATCC 36951]|uniref:Uncharacterized protein n=1 Tax=Zasmidium cellare ATCC 36951 TaxID=1080233 RepID=A0A6A6C6K0_ZASCE|nr:uncharacterized protein M409DRAFT_59521 [Zasmidium cellare ATCC 36951]KAF2160996.1 hypothetical protein M409DRAFT_59521 [Zasmidium cellare ATCC 36951]